MNQTNTTISGHKPSPTPLITTPFPESQLLQQNLHGPLNPQAPQNATSFLPEIAAKREAALQRTSSKGSVRTSNTMATDLSHFKKASPEALALMMRNLKNNNKNGGGKAWVPGGQKTIAKDDKS